jgi:hypothetical protein
MPACVWVKHEARSIPCTQPQPPSRSTPANHYGAGPSLRPSSPDTTHQPNQPTAPYKAQRPTRPCTRRAQQTTRTHPFAQGEEKRKLAYRSLRYGQDHATLRCAPADPAVTRTRRGDVAGWPCLAAALCIREYEGKYEGGLWVHVLRHWVPRMCERVKGGGECFVTKAGRTFVRRGNTITGWGFAELGGTCATHWVCV